jgi:beta-phosphoglucomutase
MQDDEFGVIFDMDGVLVLSDEAHFESWKLVARKRGVEMSRELFLSTFGQVNEDCIATMFGSQTLPDEVQRIADEKERAYRNIVRAQVPLAPGLFRLLDSLRLKGARMAVGSSAPPENVDLILDAGRLREYFSATVDGKQVANGKPAPDVFLMAAEALGLDPHRCIVIEDAPVGIEAARAAGMRAVAVATTNEVGALESAGAHVVVDDLLALDFAQIIGRTDG